MDDSVEYAIARMGRGSWGARVYREADVRTHLARLIYDRIHRAGAHREVFVHTEVTAGRTTKAGGTLDDRHVVAIVGLKRKTAVGRHLPNLTAFEDDIEKLGASLPRVPRKYAVLMLMCRDGSQATRRMLRAAIDDRLTGLDDNGVRARSIVVGARSLNFHFAGT